MKLRKTSNCLLIFLCIGFLGCSTITKQDVRNSTSNKIEWVIEKPINVVFKAYKEDLEVQFSPLNTFINGDEAEITHIITSIGSGPGYCLNIDLKGQGDRTKVTGWYRNIFWKKEIVELKELKIK